jgi:hypothetical protein
VSSSFVPALLRAHRSLAWSPTPCTIQAIKVGKQWQTGRRVTGWVYGVEIQYEYAFSGATHLSDHYGWAGYSSSAREESEAIVRRLPAGTRTTCYVNPKQPTEAVVENTFPWGWAWFPLLPLGFAAWALRSCWQALSSG